MGAFANSFNKQPFPNLLNNIYKKYSSSKNEIKLNRKRNSKF